MINIQKILLRKSSARLLLIIAGIIIVLLFPSMSASVNSEINETCRSFGGTAKPDTNIVIICIDANDLNLYGGWPVKREIYTRLITEFTKLNVRKIGIETLLANRNSEHDDESVRLNNEILKSGRVVLSSVMIQGSAHGSALPADSIIYSGPKMTNPGFVSGHLNYIDKTGLYIPSFLIINENKEWSFSERLGEGRIKGSDELIKVNLYTSWKSFNRYTLTEFLHLAEINDGQLKNFKDKIVLIGATEEPEAQMLNSAYDEKLPGVGFQAIALDNLLTGRMINYKETNLTIIFAVFMLLFISRLRLKISSLPLYAGFFLLHFAVSFALLNYRFTESNFTVFYLPVILLMIFEVIVKIFKIRWI